MSTIQLLEVGGNPWPPASLGLGAPEEAIEVSMPAYERVGTDNRQQLAPRDHARQQREGDASGVVGLSGPSLPFDVAGELLRGKRFSETRRRRNRSVDRDSHRR
jgi:hypothetical protein